MRPTASVLALALVACAHGTVDDPSGVGPVVRADHPPPAVHGGGLLLLADGHTVIVSDADRDRILVVDLASRGVIRVLSLPTDSWPGQAVASTGDRVHVVLRGAGAVMTLHAFDESTASTVDPVCAMPSGIALDGAQLVVACVGGDLVWLDPGHTAARRHHLVDDLRDVMVQDDHVYVTTFRSATVMEVDRATGSVLWSATPPDLRYGGEPFHAGVAWRALALPGRLVMLHQRSRTSSIRLGTASLSPDGGLAPPSGSPYDQRASDAGPGASRAGDDCSAIVRTDLTMFDLTTSPPTLLPGTGSIEGARLAVDLAASLAPGRTLDLLIANAGVGAASGGVRALSATVDQGLGSNGICAPSHDELRVPAAAPAVAVAFDAVGEPIVLEREPAALLHAGERIALGGISAFDTGHALFHAVTAARIACASCHPEGRDDGQSWRFDGDARRTQSLAGGLLATAPFHWDGQEMGMQDIVSEVLVRRMGGAALDDEHVAALGSWLDQVPTPRGDVADVESAARGRALFEGDAWCTRCHAGPHFTDDLTHSVGTGSFQTPSLLGVSHRLPLMRSGCATTLRARFDPACGGTEHGTVLSDDRSIDDLVSYLETL